MDLNEKKARILKLINKYAPKGTKFYWSDSSSVSSACKYKYCKQWDEFYDHEIFINIELAQKSEWAELKNMQFRR
jgi:hypothetical protein